MPDLQHILAATDLSPAALPAVERGFTLARDTGARLTLLHALGLDTLGPLRNLLGQRADEVEARLLAHQRAALEALAADPARSRGVATTVRVEPALATRVVPEVVAREAVDLVVVGARGASVARRFLLGSTASHLLRQSHCPVLVVRNPGHTPYRRALLAIDFSPASDLALRLVRTLAPTAKLELLNVFDVPFEGLLHYAGVGSDVVAQYHHDARTRAREQLHALAARHGLVEGDYTVFAEEGDAATCIAARAEALGCDLIAMGKHGTHITHELLLGSVTRHVLAQAGADLLAVVDRAPAPALAAEAP